MGQSQGKKNNEDDPIESKNYPSSRNTTDTSCEETGPCRAETEDASGHSKRRVFAKLRKSLREKTVGTKITECGSDGSVENTDVGPHSSDSKHALDRPDKGEPDKETEVVDVEPISVHKNSEKKEDYFAKNCETRKQSEQEQSCCSSRKEPKSKVSCVTTSDPSLEDRSNGEGDLKVRENKESSYAKDESPEERDTMEEELRNLETPLKWLQDILSAESLTAGVFCDLGECNRDAFGWRKSKWRHDHFRATIQHLWYSAKHCLVDGNLQKALKELSLSKNARMRFSDAITLQASSECTCKWSPEAKSGDEDLDKALGMVIDGTSAVVSFRMQHFSDATNLLKKVKKQEMSPGVMAAMKAIEASVVSSMDSQLPLAVCILREAVALTPDYWRWHSLLAEILQQLPEDRDPNKATERRKELLEALEEACQLEPHIVKEVLLLANAYRNAAFQVRRRHDLHEDSREYAKKAVLTYVAAVDCVPKCAHTHVLAARSLWSLRRMRPEASQRAILMAERAMRVLTEVDENDSGDGVGSNDEEMEGQAEAALSLALVWESIGNLDRAICLFRMAATNPFAQANIAYRAELGIIVSNFHKGKFYKGKGNSRPRVDITGQLDKLMEKYTDSDFQQQTFCHKGHYLMVIAKDSNAALDLFCKAANIRPGSPFLKRYYPRFGPSYAQPVRISDLIHELACKELAVIQVRASKGSPEAVRRANQLNKQIQMAQDMMAEKSAADDKRDPKNEDNSNGSCDASPRTETCPPATKVQPVEKEEDSPQANCDMGEPVFKKQAEESDSKNSNSIGEPITNSDPVVEKKEDENDGKNPDSIGEAITNSDPVVEKQVEENDGKNSDSIGEAITNSDPVVEKQVEDNDGKNSDSIGEAITNSDPVVEKQVEDNDGKNSDSIGEAINTSDPQPNDLGCGDGRHIKDDDKLILMFRETSV